MKLALAPLRIVEPDPRALECSIIYFKEKLEYAVESFEGSAIYNKNQTQRVYCAVMALSAITISFICCGIVYQNSKAFVAIQTIALSAGLGGAILGSCMKLRDYHSSWLAHAQAVLRLQRIVKEVTVAESNSGMTEDILEKFYGEYRSVYDDTSGMIQASCAS